MIAAPMVATPVYPAMPYAAPMVMAAPVVAQPVVQVVAKAPVARLQVALTYLGLYLGPISGVRDPVTDAALARFTAMVPAKIRQRFGNQVAAMAEAAVRREFALQP